MHKRSNARTNNISVMSLEKRKLCNFSEFFSGAKSILRLSSVALLFFLSACQTAPTSPGGAPGGSSSPSIPSSGGSSGSPSPEESSSQQSSSSSESESGESSDSESSSESSSESGGEAGDTDTAPDWEEDLGAEGSADGSAGEEGEVTFEEAEAEGSQDDVSASDEVSSGDEVSFEEPEFSEDGGLTEQEIEDLEKELNESLGDFDEEIQREKTFAEERANDNADGESLGGVGVFERYEEEQENSDANGQSSASASAASSSSESTSSSSAQEDGSEASNAGTVTGDEVSKGDGIDEEADETADLPVDVPENIETDDIVARQIREAAENEVDPELKEKLWAEYRKYKNQ